MNGRINGKKLILMGDDWKNLNKNDSPKKHGHSVKRWLVSASFLLFIFNIWKFINTP